MTHDEVRHFMHQYVFKTLRRLLGEIGIEPNALALEPGKSVKCETTVPLAGVSETTIRGIGNRRSSYVNQRDRIRVHYGTERRLEPAACEDHRRPFGDDPPPAETAPPAQNDTPPAEAAAACGMILRLPRPPVVVHNNVNQKNWLYPDTIG